MHACFDGFHWLSIQYQWVLFDTATDQVLAACLFNCILLPPCRKVGPVGYCFNKLSALLESVYKFGNYVGARQM